MRSVHQRALEEQARQARALEERLKRTEELLAARSAELSETRTFLSTTDRLSEVEALGIVRDLNENIFQVAVSLADEWEKLEPSQATSRMDIDPASLPSGSALIQLARNRDLMGLTYLLQSCLCSQAAKMTSSWSRHRELVTLKSVHERLSASGEHHNFSPRECFTDVSQGGKQPQPGGGRWPTATSPNPRLTPDGWWSSWREPFARQGHSRPPNTRSNSFKP